STSRRRGRLVVLHLSVLEGRLDRSRRGLSLRAALELRPGELSSLRGDLDKANRLHGHQEILAPLSGLLSRGTVDSRGEPLSLIAGSSLQGEANLERDRGNSRRRDARRHLRRGGLSTVPRRAIPPRGRSVEVSHALSS